MTSPAASADPAEIAKFEALAHRFWDSEGEFKPLHRLNPVRVDYVAARARLEGARVLDVGCGGGLLAEALAAARRTGHRHRSGPGDDPDRAAACGGIGPEHRLSSAGCRRAGRAVARMHSMSCAAWKCWNTWPIPASFSARCWPDWSSPAARCSCPRSTAMLKSFLLAIVGAEYRAAAAAARARMTTSASSGPRNWRPGVAPPGSSLVHTAGLHYDPFRDRCELNDDVAVNYLAHLVPAGPALEPPVAARRAVRSGRHAARYRARIWSGC